MKQQLLYFCMCIYCPWNIFTVAYQRPEKVFTKPLPNNVMGNIQTHKQQGDLIRIILFF
jgi:hypothetical protein